MFKRILKLTIMTIAVFGAAAGFSTVTVASASASSQVAATATVPAAPNYPSTSDRCVNQSHTIPCWALTITSGTIYLRSGGSEPIGGNDLVLISCYYISGGTVSDHVIAEDAGGDPEIGHIADSNIDLNNRSPWNLQYSPNIPPC
jgi:hypothetical protein